MRIARTLLPACAAALFTLPFGVTNASANQAVDINQENGNACSPCFVHAEGESEIHHGFFGEISDCADEFEGEIYQGPSNNEWGHVYHWQGVDHPVDGPCTRENCDGTPEGANESEWPIGAIEKTSSNPDKGEMHVEFCLDAISEEPEGTGMHCVADVIYTELVNHATELETNQFCATPFGNVQVTGHWRTEAGSFHEEIEFNP